MPDFSTSEAFLRGARMLRTALGPAIAAFLEDSTIVEVMLNPDGRLWVDRLSGGLEDTGATLSPAAGERIIRLVAHHVGAEVHAGTPRVSAELPETGERFEGLLPPVVTAPAFAIRKPAVAVFTLDDYVTAGIMRAGQAMILRRANPDCRALILTGAGRGFCAGQDLDDPRLIPADGSPPDVGAIIEHSYKPVIQRSTGARIPTLAAVNGVAAGAGVSLALACDITVAARSAVFIQAFSKVGLVPDAGGTWFLPQRIGYARSLGLALLAEKLSAEQAANWGLIWSCVDDSPLSPITLALAGRLALGPTQALILTREAMLSHKDNSLENHLSVEGNFAQTLSQGENFLEGVQAFRDRRSPNFIRDTKFE